MKNWYLRLKLFCVKRRAANSGLCMDKGPDEDGLKGYVCTELKGHEGDHTARPINERWPQRSLG